MRALIYIRDVVTLDVDPEKCVGCGICLAVCPHAVLGMRDRRIWIENRDACMECGACAQNCPTGAVTVQAGVGCATAVINAALICSTTVRCGEPSPGSRSRPTRSASRNGTSSSVFPVCQSPASLVNSVRPSGLRPLHSEMICSSTSSSK